MLIEKYLDESAKTESKDFHIDRVDPLAMEILIRSCIEEGKHLDALKKACFYGKMTDTLRIQGGEQSLEISPEVSQLLHFTMGLVTESSEVLEAVYNHIFNGKELDLVNIEEEIGDIFWYIAIFLRVSRADFNGILDGNIKKLRSRYGEKFSSDKALNRDTATERVILEESSSSLQKVG